MTRLGTLKLNPQGTMIRALVLFGYICAAVLTPSAAQTARTTRPACICPMIFLPVCGDDGITYPNDCEARCNGNTHWQLGTCDSLQNVDLACVDGRNVISEVDGISRSHIANWTFYVNGTGDYTISTCHSDMDTQLQVDGGTWIDRDHCNGVSFGGESFTAHWVNGTNHTIHVRAYSSAGAARINISAPVVCANASVPPSESELLCGNEIRGYLAPHENFTIPLRITSSLLNTNVVVSSCGSSLDTELRLLQNGVQLDYNDDNAYYCRNRSAAIVVEGSQIVNRSIGTYDVVLTGYGGQSGPYSLELECGGDAPEDPCLKGCPPGQSCYTLDPRNETCRMWYRNHNYTDRPPRSCRGCFPRSDACSRNGHNCTSQSTSSYCTIDLDPRNASLQSSCCDNRYPKPDFCYGCASRIEPPRGCPRPTYPPSNTTRPVRTITTTTTTPARRQACGSLEVFDADTCDKFCANSHKQGGVSKQALWSHNRGPSQCCCLDGDGRVDSQFCCEDMDVPNTASPVSCSVFSTCARTATAMLNSSTVLEAVIRQDQSCDWTTAPGSPEKEACHAVQTAVHAYLGSTFYGCCPCIKRLQENNNWGVRGTWLNNLDCNN